jgi:hypothetical protein
MKLTVSRLVNVAQQMQQPSTDNSQLYQFMATHCKIPLRAKQSPSTLTSFSASIHRTYYNDPCLFSVYSENYITICEQTI